jgi:lambda family phage tail tape measure protein
MANEVKLKLAIEGGQVVAATLDGVDSRIGTMGKSAKEAATGMDGMASAMKSLAVAGSALATIRMADSITTLNTQLRLSTGNAKEAGQAFNALFDMAQQSRVSFTELGTTFAAVARSGKELGISQTRLLAVTQSISQAMTIGGGSAASMQAALVQLGQGLSSGTLRGEELNSVMEQTPRLAKAIADGLGVPIGELRRLGETGQLTSEKVISALEKSAPQLAREMSGATLTVGQAFTMLTNSATKFVGDADAASGASGSLANAMKGLSSAIDTVGTTIKNNETAFAAVAYGLAGTATIAGVTSLAGVISTRLIPALLGVGVAAGPITLVAMAIGAIGGTALAVGDAWGKSAQGMATSAAQLANQIAAIDKATVAGLNDRGYKASAADNAEMAALRQKLVVKQALLRQQMALKDAGDIDTSNEDRRLNSSTAPQKEKERALRAFNEADQSTAAKNQAVLASAVEVARNAYEVGAITAAEYAKRINDVQASFKKTAPGISEAAKAQKLLNDLNAESMGFKPDFAQQWISISKGVDATKGMTAAQTELLSQQPLMKEKLRAEEEAFKSAARAKEDDFQELLKGIEAREKARKAMADLRAAQQAEIAGMGQGDAARQKASGVAQRQAQFADQPELLAQALDDYDTYLAQKSAAEASWALGAKDSMANYLSEIGNVYKSASSMATRAFKGMEDALVAFVRTGKLDFASLADSILSDLVRIQVQQSIMPGMSAAMNAGASWLGSFFADGGAFNSGGVQAFANGGSFTNQVVSSPTLFKFASGTGLMGEAGPEAIMPLTRAPNGKLGVQASGGGNSMVVNIIESPGNGGQQSRRSENGVDILDVFVEKVKTAIAGDISRGQGAVPNAMSATYGLNRVAGAY